MVHGAREVSQHHSLYMFTITTRGSGISIHEAHEKYYEWTNRLFAALRAEAKRNDTYWCYVQVTEHQKRGHPHSHLITSYRPADMRLGWFYKWRNNGGKRYKAYYETFRSEWLQKRLSSAGLGHVYDYNMIRETEAASRYVAKYLFKDSMFTNEFPKNWRRVRYSRNWPKLPESGGEGFPLLTDEDWRRLARETVTVTPDDEQSLLEIIARMQGADVVIDTRLVDDKL